jgi:putative ABC transport system permease protein
MTGELVREAAATLRVNPLRAGLAGLAVAAAVFSITTIVTALGAVEQSARLASERAFGSETFLITRVAAEQSTRRELADKLARNPVLRRADARFLSAAGEGAVLYAPVAQRRGDVTAGALKYESAAINGTTEVMAELRDVGVARGRFLSDPDVTAAAPVIVIGADVADTLFPAHDAIGGSVRVAGRRFVVIGVQDRQGTSGGQSLDRYAWMPLTSYERVFGEDPGLQIFGRAVAKGQARAAEDFTRIALRARRSIQPGRPETFDIVSPEAARGFVSRLSERVGAAAVPISVMALLAAVVVVTNTMLVSVAQRTREIGIRRAIGGRRRAVLLEVLAEATMISLAGAVAGVAAAVVVLRVASRAVDVPLAVTPWIAWHSVMAATVSGVVAGWYPARRAARLDVIAALRQE